MISDRLPAAVGPYSLGKIIKNSDGSVMAYTSGQLGLDPKTNLLVEGGIKAETEQAMTNLKNLASDNGFDLAKHAIKNTLYVTDMKDFVVVNEIYKNYFSEYPARTTVGVKELPKGAKFEIDSVLYKSK